MGTGTEKVGWAGSEVGNLIWGQVHRTWMAIRTLVVIPLGVLGRGRTGPDSGLRGPLWLLC